MAKKLALIIGIENYPKSSGQDKARYAKNDAFAIAHYALQAGFSLINSGKPLIDKEASYKNVVKMLKSLSDYVNPEDFILIYYAGHGYYAEGGGYLIPFDYKNENDVDESSCISFDSFEKRFKDRIPSRFLFFLDTCNSGSVDEQFDLRKMKNRNENISPQIRKKIEEQMNRMVHLNESGRNISRVIFTSSSSHEKSHSIPKLKHGLFTYYLLSNLKIKKDESQINVEELIFKVKADIEKFCIEHNLPRQTPTAYTKIEGNFNIPAFKWERKPKYKMATFNSDFSKKQGELLRDLSPDNTYSNKIIEKTITGGEISQIKTVYYKKKIVAFISIFIILFITFAIFIKVKEDKVKAEKIEKDNRDFKNVITNPTINSINDYIVTHQDGHNLSKAQKLLGFLKEMPSEVYSLHLLPKIKILKNEKGYWEAYFEEFEISTIFIPSGIFKIGQTEKEKVWLLKQMDKKTYNNFYKNETPIHEVFLSGYWIGKTEVTNKQYVIFLNDSGIDHRNGCQQNQCIDTFSEYDTSRIKGSKGQYYVESDFEDYPVTDISWYGAIEYCNWLSKKVRFNFNLPTEAQWERAARWNGSVEEKYAFIFPWGDLEPDKTLANFNSSGPVPVDSYHKGASPSGLLNMAGNVWEWCFDKYDANYYSKSVKENPIGPKEGKFRIRRGGCWKSNAVSLRCAGRKEEIPSKRYSNVGFRISHNSEIVVKQQLP